MTRVIDGKALAEKLQGELAEKTARLKAETGQVPGLVVILVGENPASQVYVRNKERSALAAGFRSEVVRVPESISQEDLLALIDRYNQDPLWHGILVQLPLPAHIDDEAVLLAIDPNKDVDGFHPLNMGHLWAGNPVMVPSTPAGIMEMFREYDIDVGMNRDENGKLCGDVDYEQVAPLASYITPVPGGVGPMTITMLMSQTYEAAVRALKK